MTYPEHLDRHTDRTRAREQGITALDIPTGSGIDDDTSDVTDSEDER